MKELFTHIHTGTVKILKLVKTFTNCTSHSQLYYLLFLYISVLLILFPQSRLAQTVVCLSSQVRALRHSHHGVSQAG